MELVLQLEDVAQRETSLQGEYGAARIRGGLEGIVELILGHPLRIEILMGA
jgi:hypothetical protein